MSHMLLLNPPRNSLRFAGADDESPPSGSEDMETGTATDVSAILL